MPDVFTSNTVKRLKPSAKAGFREPVSLDEKQVEALEKEKKTQSINIGPDTNIHSLPGHNHNPLSAFCFYPDKVKFANADHGEKVILLLRRHPFTNLPWMLAAFVMIIMPAFATVISFIDTMPFSLVILIMLTWYLITTAFILEQFLDWYFNVNIVTDERIFDVDFINLMYREITEADLDQIQDVTVEVGGAARTFFSYGDVLIQTAAQIPRIEFTAVPNPDRVAKILRELGIQEEIERMEGRIR